MKEKIKALQTIHLAICGGVIIAYATLGKFSIETLKIETLKIETIDSSEIVYVLIPVIAFVLSNFLFKMQLKQVNPKQELLEKLPVYQTASVIRWAIL